MLTMTGVTTEFGSTGVSDSLSLTPSATIDESDALSQPLAKTMKSRQIERQMRMTEMHFFSMSDTVIFISHSVSVNILADRYTT